MNIKNPRAHELAREVADLTGESITGAVTTSLAERLERLRAEGRSGMAAALIAIGKDAARRLPPDLRELDPDTLLYGEEGLPR